MLPPNEEIQRIVVTALGEDVGHGDITTALTIDESHESTYRIMARDPLIACGAQIAAQVIQVVDPTTTISLLAKDGAAIQAGGVLAEISGKTQAIMTGERVALNLLQRMCAIATYTRQFVDAVAGTGAVILDTRKTMPGLRAFDKYAVRAGGGTNHRMRLDDAIMIKDNHIAAVGDIAAAVKRVQDNAPATMKIEVECDSFAQVQAVAPLNVDVILLDNMHNDQLREAVQFLAANAPKTATEASGNVTLESVRAIAETGVGYISIGRLTYAPPSLDIGLDAV